jgi:hypothetical protein
MKTYITKIILIFILSAASNKVITQSITSTLGTNGIFSIKNGLTTYFSLTQSTGQVNIPTTLELDATTSSTKGVIYKGSNRFMHTYGSRCMFLGENSGNFTHSGPWNTGIGSTTLNLLTTGNSNTAFGTNSLSKNTSGNENSAFGLGSLMFNTTGSMNTAFGNSALRQNETASENSAFGFQSIGGINSGSNNSGFGFQSLYLNTSGRWNSAFGTFSLFNNSTGMWNMGFGYNAGSSITTGTNLICIGYNSQPTSSSASNQITLGNSSVTVLRCNQTAISSLSDMRDKKNIRDLTLGLHFIMTLRPREYNWDKREWYEGGVPDGTKMQEAPTAGFIAQELDDAQISANAQWLNLVLKDNPEKWEATPGNLLPVIVKAVQELNVEIENTKNAGRELTEKYKDFEERISRLEQAQNELAVEIKNSSSQNYETILEKK